MKLGFFQIYQPMACCQFGELKASVPAGSSDGQEESSECTLLSAESDAHTGHAIPMGYYAMNLSSLTIPTVNQN